MSGSVNKVILIGNLGDDPSIRHTNDGRPIANLRIATSESWRDKGTGERKEKTEWNSVVIFSEGLCKIAEQYLRKGSKVYLEGQLQTRKWTDKDGNDRYSTEVVLQGFNATLVMLDGKSSEFPDQRQIPTENPPAQPHQDSGQSFARGDADEIPFMMEWR
jgi:single-strand DNA-binding protein